ncbi:hypothetical protein C1646_608316, partial [Rhizophagus diaphanus]
MQEREFQNMFIFSPGFEAATLKIPQKDSSDDDASANGSSIGNGTINGNIGFAKFRTKLEALEARDILSGRKVDAEKGSVLKAEMAKKNLHTKQLPHAMSALSINTTISPSVVSSSPSIPSPGFRPPNPADQNPPCNTLYVGNLPMNTSEEELKNMFSCCPGYKRMCFRTKQNGPMCFVEFEDVHYATQAMNELYGNLLSNSVKGGIRLSFSKNPLGVRSNNNGSHTSLN